MTDKHTRRQRKTMAQGLLMAVGVGVALGVAEPSAALGAGIGAAFSGKWHAGRRADDVSPGRAR